MTGIQNKAFKSYRFEGFVHTSLQNVLHAPYSITLNKEAMQVTISFPSFIPKAMIETASGANAFMLTAMAASLPRQSHENLLLQLPVTDHQPDHPVIVALAVVKVTQL